MSDDRDDEEVFFSDEDPAARHVNGTAFVAEAILRRCLQEAGLDHIVQGMPGLVGIVGVDADDARALAGAAERLLRRQKPERFGADVCVCNWTGDSLRKTKNFETSVIGVIERGDRSICLFSDEAAVPPLFAAAADGMTSIGAVYESVVEDAVMEILGERPPPEAVAALAALPLKLIGVALRKGRSLAHAVEAAERLTEVCGSASPSIEPPAAPPPPDAPRLEKLPGMGEAGDWGASLARDLSDYRAGRLAWKEVDRGVLLSGPPGTGKTTFARALARSCDVPLHVHSLAQWQACGHLGDLLHAMRSAFDEAKAAAPCILFVDEIDAFASRDGMQSENAQYHREVINGFLECLDGAAGRDGVVVIGASNRPEVIDAALVRPGRLGKHIVIPLPDQSARIDILRLHLGDDLPGEPLVEIAQEMDGASGAVLEQIVRDARRRARSEARNVRIEDLKANLPRGIRLSDDALRRACIHEAGHLVVGLAVALEAGSIPTGARVKRDVREQATGTTSIAAIEGFDHTRGSYLASIVMLLAGLAAEEHVLGSRGDGCGGIPGSDLVRATVTAVRLEFSLGLGDSLIAVPGNELKNTVVHFLGAPGARRRIEAVLQQCLERARTIVAERSAEVEAISRVLLEKGEIVLAPTVSVPETAERAAQPRASRRRAALEETVPAAPVACVVVSPRP